MNTKTKFKIVIIESAYDHWDSKLTQKYFSDAVSLKLRGYKAEYPYGILPVDTTDFISTHHLLCKETDLGLYPLMAYKSITYQKATIHNLPFPILNLAKSIGINKHEEAINNIVLRCESDGLKLSYDSSWTIDPETRKDRELTQTLRNIMTALHSLYHHNAKTDEIISLGSLRFKMERLFLYWGYNPIALESKPLDQFIVPSYFNEPVMMFHQTSGFSKQALEDARVYMNLWDDRLVLDITQLQDKQIKVA